MVWFLVFFLYRILPSESLRNQKEVLVKLNHHLVLNLPLWHKNRVFKGKLDLDLICCDADYSERNGLLFLMRVLLEDYIEVLNGQIAVVIVVNDRLVHLQSHEAKGWNACNPTTSILPLFNLRNIWYHGNLILGRQSKLEVYLGSGLLRETWALFYCLFLFIIFICGSRLGWVRFFRQSRLCGIFLRLRFCQSFIQDCIDFHGIDDQVEDLDCLIYSWIWTEITYQR